MQPILRDPLTRDNYIFYSFVRLAIAIVILTFVALAAKSLYFGPRATLSRTTATVIENRQHVLGESTNDEETIYTPVLKYDVDGRTYTASSGVSAQSRPYTIGQTVEIEYDPATPSSPYQPAHSRAYATVFLAAFLTIGVMQLIRTIAQFASVARSR